MIRRRSKPDGLPFNVYERTGVRIYSIGRKNPRTGAWDFRLSCPVGDAAITTKSLAHSRRPPLNAEPKLHSITLP